MQDHGVDIHFAAPHPKYREKKRKMMNSKYDFVKVYIERGQMGVEHVCMRWGVTK